MRRSAGAVKFFDDKRGFGFICPDDGGAEVFFHRANLQESCRVDGELTLRPDDLVEFDLVDAGRGPKAVSVSLK